MEYRERRDSSPLLLRPLSSLLVRAVAVGCSCSLSTLELHRLREDRGRVVLKKRDISRVSPYEAPKRGNINIATKHKTLYSLPFKKKSG